MGRGHRNCPLADPERRSHRRCLSAIERSRRDQRYPALLREADPQDQSAHHDRHDRSAFGRTVSYLLPGQEHHQFNQSGRRGREVRTSFVPSPTGYGAALVVGCIDEDPVQAQAFTRERKLAVAERSVALLTDKIRRSARRHHHRSAGLPLRDG